MTVSVSAEHTGTANTVDGDRVIRKPDGTVVRIAASGETTIARPDGSSTTTFPDGRIRHRAVDGTVVEHTPKRRLPPERRPLNIASGSAEDVGRLLSNLAPTPFVLDGRRYASVEAFYVGLKVLDPARRAALAGLDGKEARAAGRDSSLTHTVYEGVAIELGSPAHHALIKRALRAKLEQHPDLRAAFVATRPRPLVHQTGRPERATTKLPAALVRLLEEVREELAGVAAE
jgi:predicted NAD-dependent protein-ADP-ribosyltransferase YbiA (DUF1768 family)